MNSKTAEKAFAFATLTIICLLLGVGAVGVTQHLHNQIKKQADIQREEERKAAQEERKAIEAMSSVQSFNNQKITQIKDGVVTLENGTTFSTSGSIPCVVGDMIVDYDRDQDAIRCERQKADGQKEYVYIPTSSSTDLLDFALAWALLSNNGYSYDSSARVYRHSSGSEYSVGQPTTSDSGPSRSKPSISKTKSAPTTSHSKSGRSSSTSSSNSGRGGVSSGSAGKSSGS